MNTQLSVPQSQSIKITLPSLAQNITAFAFGAAILYAVGFAPLQAAHNAAHDTRHALAFPCH